MRQEEDLHVGAPRLVEEMLELCHIRTEIKGHLCLSLCLISLLHLYVVCVCLGSDVSRSLSLEKLCVFGEKERGGGEEEEEEAVITLSVLFHSVSLLTSSSLFFCFFLGLFFSFHVSSFSLLPSIFLF